uniref:Glutaredoxin domain-containing protein n=1 Tax=Branchiostoma floridae TaxID=7739 RepID=C3XWA6_BRAFL|eukprot:XP_002611630.1 hypothetical protein BRAFLDRAFT_63706 [Branchiostoma floridae]
MNKLRFKWGGNGSEKKDKEPKNYVNGGDHYSLQPDTGEYCQDPAVQTNGDVPGEHPGNSRVQFSPGAASPAGWTYYVTQTSQEEGEEDENRRLRYVGKRDYSGGVEDTEIVSRNGTVRGVKNRVRAGLAHFTSLTQGAQGAERLDQLNEAGELRKLLSRFEKITVRSLCARCGGYRYIPCTVCNGSRKSVHRNNFTDMFRQLNCTACNENGLQRCPVCDEDMEEEHVSYI